MCARCYMWHGIEGVHTHAGVTSANGMVRTGLLPHARKLAIALGRHDTAQSQSADAGKADGRRSGSDVWLAKPSQIWTCQSGVSEMGPIPIHAIVCACSRAASRNGAAGYNVIRLSHARASTSTLDLLNAPLRDRQA